MTASSATAWLRTETERLQDVSSATVRAVCHSLSDAGVEVIAEQGNSPVEPRNLRFVTIDDPNVTGFVKTSDNGTNTVAAVIALSRDPHDIWLPLNDVQVKIGDEMRTVVAVENLLTGERHAVEWGGLRLRIDPSHDPALLFRCMA